MNKRKKVALVVETNRAEFEQSLNDKLNDLEIKSDNTVKILDIKFSADTEQFRALIFYTFV